MDGELEAVLVLVDQALDLDEVVLLEGVDGVLDVVPHLGFDVAAAIAQGEGQVRLTAFLGFDLAWKPPRKLEVMILFSCWTQSEMKNSFIGHGLSTRFRRLWISATR